MSSLNFTNILTQTVDELSESTSYKGLIRQHTDGNPLPSGAMLCEIVELARAILFPGYFGNATLNSRTINYHIGVNVERLMELLTQQIFHIFQDLCANSPLSTFLVELHKRTVCELSNLANLLSVY